MVKNGNKKIADYQCIIFCINISQITLSHLLLMLLIIQNPYNFCCDPRGLPCLQSHPALLHFPWGRKISQSHPGSGYSFYQLSGCLWGKMLKISVTEGTSYLSSSL